MSDKVLTERESDVIRMRFGIGIADDMTLQQIGYAIGVTKERVRQIEASALDKLRTSSRYERLRSFGEGLCQ
jgi:RNA polymerase primary sigma factor